MPIKWFKNNSNTSNYLILLVFVFVLMSLIIPSKFLSTTNLQSMAFQLPEFGILALAMTVAMLTGGIDLAIISTANLSGILAVILMKGIIVAYPSISSVYIVLVTVFAAILSGMLCGLFNGFLIAIVGISPILATLGTMKLYEGISVVVTKGQPIRGVPDVIQFIANGTIGPIPFPLIIFLLVILGIYFLLHKSSLGFKIFMLGTNPIAARFSGLNNKLILVKTYMISGLLAGMASIIMMSRFNSVKVGYGNSYLLQTVLVAILGGVDPAGGKGKVLGVVFGIVTLQFISSGFNIIGFTNYIRNVIFGTMLVSVMIFRFLVPLVMTRFKKIVI